MDEGVLIWLAIGAIYIVFKIIQSQSRKEEVKEKIEEQYGSIPELTLRPKVEKIEGIECIVVYGKGWINSKRNHSINGKVTLSLYDKTNDPADLVFTSNKEYGEKNNPFIFCEEREVELRPDSYYQDYSKVFVIPINVLAFPHKGKRKIQATIFYGTDAMVIDFGVPKNTNTGIGAATAKFDLEVKNIGYKEYEKNALDFEEAAIELAMLTAAIDGSLDQLELDIIKQWCSKRSHFIKDKNEAQEKKTNLAKLVQKTYKLAKDQKLTMSKIMSKIKNDLSDDQRYKVVELMLDVMAADSVLDEKENDLIERTVKSLNLDYKTFKAMRDVRLSKLTKIDLTDGADEKLFGLDDKMSKEKKCTELRKQYSKWSGLTTSSEKTKRDQANKMVEKIAKLRQSLNC